MTFHTEPHTHVEPNAQMVQRRRRNTSGHARLPRVTDAKVCGGHTLQPITLQR